MKQFTTHLLPWLITIVALYFAFHGVEWSILFEHLGQARPHWIFVAFLLTMASYLLRGRRWQHLFTEATIGFLDSVQVLILGFFMNNVLPARTGELVRAHMGSKVTGETRTLVLASIACERLADGVTLSLLFLLFSLHLGDEGLSRNLFYVALLFGAVALATILLLLFRQSLFALAERFNRRFQYRATGYLVDRFRIFINGLAPLFTLRRLPVLVLSSLLIWTTELCVYVAVTQAYGSELGLAQCVLFMVAVNFSSLIPAAPGGLGVIEAVGSAVLVSIGVPKELALTMVITQHAIQYLVVGIPGALILFSWKNRLRELESLEASKDVSMIRS